MSERESGVPKSAREWKAPKESREQKESKPWSKSELITAVDRAMQEALDKRDDPPRHRLTVEAVAQKIAKGAGAAIRQTEDDYDDESELEDPGQAEWDNDSIFGAQEVLAKHAKPGKGEAKNEDLKYLHDVLPKSFRVEDLVEQLRKEVDQRPSEPTFLLPRVIGKEKYIDLAKVKRLAGEDRPVYAEFEEEDWAKIVQKSQKKKSNY